MGRDRHLTLVVFLCFALAARAGADEPASSGIGRWFNPATAPIIPVPAIDIDPNSGTTLGVIPVYLVSDQHGEIGRIYAPDLVYNQYFGWGVDARLFAYPSANTQWYIEGGAKERVESNFDAQYWTGRLREDRWSFLTELTYDRSGTNRFYGVGNGSRIFDQVVYVNQQKFFIAQIGFNITPHWQLAYRLMPREVEILPGKLPHIPPIDEKRFPGLLGIGVTHEFLNRVLLTYDSRDDLTIPTRGGAVVLYGGVASRDGGMNSSLFEEAGVDARWYWSPNPSRTWAAHMSLNFLPIVHRIPFWALSSIGGDQSIIGGAQPLRGFGVGRFYDRDSFSLSVEMRQRVATFNAVSTRIELQITPFIDTGTVFSRSSDSPVTALHKVFGVGFRGLARPFVVGFVDLGVGSEGVAVFTGINYPF